MACDLAQRYGINTFHAERGVEYLQDLHEMGVAGKGKEIDCDLPFDRIEDVEFAERFLRMIALLEGIGDEMAEGFPRAACGGDVGRRTPGAGSAPTPTGEYAEHG